MKKIFFSVIAYVCYGTIGVVLVPGDKIEPNQNMGVLICTVNESPIEEWIIIDLY